MAEQSVVTRQYPLWREFTVEGYFHPSLRFYNPERVPLCEREHSGVTVMFTCGPCSHVLS
ncbi:hypothetical protein J6590_077226 [Homalodisca vitripennis]|nr:hypothetical protein J6590_077226 [Homalodisca vitripennis]